MPEANVKYMTQILKGCKYLFIIRDPYERAVSQWRMVISRKYEHEAFNEAELNKEFDEWIKNDRLYRGEYSSIINTYSKHVDLEKHFLFLPFGELKARPQTFLKKIYNYIGISDITRKNQVNHHTSPRSTISAIMYAID